MQHTRSHPRGTASSCVSCPRTSCLDASKPLRPLILPGCSSRVRSCCSPSTTTTLVGAYQSKVRHVPGYTGHVPDVKNAVGKTYGSATEDLVSRPIDAKVDRKTLKKVTCTSGCFLALVLFSHHTTLLQASLDAYAVPTSPQRPALDLDTTGLYLKYR